MIDDHIKSDIPAYLSGALLESHRRQLDAHVASCDACRHALSKARAKLSRAKRQALKNAVPDPLPNLLINRLGKQTGWGRPPRRGVRKWVGLLLVAGGGTLLVTRRNFRLSSVSSHASTSPVSQQTWVVTSTAAAVAPHAAAVVTRVAVSTPASAPEPEEPFKPIAWSGPDGGVKDFREVVVRGRSAWRALWEEMGQPAPAPHLNFYDVFVVGVFAGEQPSAGYQVSLASPKEESDNVVVAYKVTEPPADAVAAAVVTHPYSLVTIPRTAKQIRFAQEALP